MNFSFWQKWLQWIAIVVAIFGAILAVGYRTPLFQGMHGPINSPFFQTEQDITPSIQAMEGFMVALLGAVMAAWSVMIAFVAAGPFRRQERWAWQCLAASLAAWFLLDEGFSIYYRVYFNALGNLVFLAVLALPLVFTYPAFWQKDASLPKVASGSKAR